MFYTLQDGVVLGSVVVLCDDATVVDTTLIKGQCALNNVYLHDIFLTYQALVVLVMKVL